MTEATPMSEEERSKKLDAIRACIKVYTDHRPAGNLGSPLLWWVGQAHWPLSEVNRLGIPLDQPQWIEWRMAIANLVGLDNLEKEGFTEP